MAGFRNRRGARHGQTQSRAAGRDANQGIRQVTQLGRKLETGVVLLAFLFGTFAPYAPAQTAAPTQNAQRRGDTAVPATPQPIPTQPLYLRPTARDFTQPKSHIPNPIAPYRSASLAAPKLTNSPRLHQLLRDGKIYLSLDDAVTLALENNFDIAIARYNLDIADTEILRAKSGQGGILGVPTGLVTGTIGGAATLVAVGGGPGGTTQGQGGAGTGSAGLSLSTNGAGPLPEVLDPNLTGTVQYERVRTPQSSIFFPTGSASIESYNFNYNQGFLTGTSLTVGFNNTRTNTVFPVGTPNFNTFDPSLNSTFRAQVTQHLLQGFGVGLNGRLIVQAKNNRRITDASFRQQVLFTINQIEDIYWGLVSAYEDTQAKERATVQSRQLAADNRRQLQIGTMAPLDVVNSDSQVATDQQALIQSQSSLNYQQLLMKQAIARNLDESDLRDAPVIPTDRVSLVPTPEENRPVEDLVQMAYANRPEVEQSVLTLKDDEITLRAVKNALLPTVDAYAFYGAQALGGQVNPQIFTSGRNGGVSIPPGSISNAGYSDVFTNLFNNSSPDKGVGVNINIPIRNRFAQSQQLRAVLEYRQAQLRLQQIYVTIRNQVENSVFALTNDRALVESSQAAREYGAQQLAAEQKKYRFGASTTAAVLQQQRNLAAQENNVIAATAAYARDRSQLSQVLANTLTKYGISLEQAASGKITQPPVIPGLEAPKPFSQPAALEPGKIPEELPLTTPVSPAANNGGTSGSASHAVPATKSAPQTVPQPPEAPQPETAPQQPQGPPQPPAGPPPGTPPQ